MNTNSDILNFHMALIKPDLKYYWICTECIQTHGKNSDVIIQGNNKKYMKKLIKLHCNDENHELAVACNIFYADLENKREYEEFLRENKEKLEELVSQF